MNCIECGNQTELFTETLNGAVCNNCYSAFDTCLHCEDSFKQLGGSNRVVIKTLKH